MRANRKPGSVQMTVNDVAESRQPPEHAWMRRIRPIGAGGTKGA